MTAGFLIAGFMITSAFDEWAENPVVTTMDSIAAPITNIQFPTVTLCNDEYEIPNSWAFPEMVLNFTSLACEDGKNKQDCETFKKLRNDFNFLWEPILADFKSLFFQNKKDIINAPLLKWDWTSATAFDEDYNYYDYYHYYEDKDNLKCDGGNVCQDFLAEMIANKTLSVNLLNDLAQTSLGMNTRMISLVEKAFGIELPKREKDGLYCKSMECQGELKILNVYLSLLYLSKNGKTPGFGTLLKYFTGMEREGGRDNFISFLKSTTDSYPVDFKCNSKSLGLKKGEIMIHEYMKGISKLVGFSDEELVSIYDLPGMLTLIQYDREGKLGPQSYVYSRCQNDVDFKETDLFNCYHDWNIYAHGVSGTGKNESL